ncbi:hypothetical protein D3C87_1251000 [compost metagenome]
MGAMPCSRSTPAVGAVPPSAVRTLPSPISVMATWESGARSPLAPSEPTCGTAGVMPASRYFNNCSMTSGRTAE